jgi:DNA-binding response OmpR family regulator
MPDSFAGHSDSPRDDRMILVVDDEECILRLVGEILARSGFEVIGARTGQAALEAFKLKPGWIAAVLLDVHLPDLDGISLIPMLRETNLNIAIILTSGYRGENRSGQFGPQVSFLQKPYKSYELIAAVQMALTRAAASIRPASFPVRARSAA